MIVARMGTNMVCMLFMLMMQHFDGRIFVISVTSSHAF